MFEFYPETRAGQRSVIRVPEDVQYDQVGDSDVNLPRQFEVVVWPDDSDARPAHRASFAMLDGRPVCMGAGAFMVTPDYRPVQTADLRAIRIQDMLDHAVDYLAGKRTVPEPFEGGWVIGPDPSGGSSRAVQQARRRVNDDQLREVARIYEANINGAPTAAVRDHFDISLRTASNWVKRATERGFIKQRQRKGE